MKTISHKNIFYLKYNIGAVLEAIIGIKVTKKTFTTLFFKDRCFVYNLEILTQSLSSCAF